MVSLSEFIWLIHALLLILYAYDIGRYFYYKKTYPAIYDELKNNDASLFDLAMKNEQVAGFAISVVLAHNVFFSIAVEAISIPLIAFSGTGVVLGLMNEVVSPIIKQKKREDLQQKKSEDFENMWDDEAEETDKDFGFDKEKFSDDNSNKAKTETAAHRTDRHPDDSKLWAVVDDPSFSEGERKNAFDMILRKQAKRNSGTGKDVVKT